MEEVIRFENVDKEYLLYNKKNANFIKALFYPESKINKKFALKKANFSIKQGEKVAFIGKNGSGKSTILKLIAGITYPTNGNIIVNKNIGTLLDITGGFEMDFTGRENIYLRCTALGLKKNEIKQIEKSIIDFADIGEYIDYPIKYYSNGMGTRLGFAISTHMNTDILVIDEVLSVGDKEFREKCLTRIKELVNDKSLTLILVTHSGETAEQFCNRGIVIEEGTIVYDGDIKSSLKYYNSK